MKAERPVPVAKVVGIGDLQRLRVRDVNTSIDMDDIHIDCKAVYVGPVYHPEHNPASSGDRVRAEFRDSSIDGDGPHRIEVEFFGKWAAAASAVIEEGDRVLLTGAAPEKRESFFPSHHEYRLIVDSCVCETRLELRKKGRPSQPSHLDNSVVLNATHFIPKKRVQGKEPQSQRHNERSDEASNKRHKPARPDKEVAASNVRPRAQAQAQAAKAKVQAQTEGTEPQAQAPVATRMPAEYTYVTIAEAKTLPERKLCHLYGVVQEFSFPKESKGQDWFQTMTVVDESCPSLAEGLKIILFSSHEKYIEKIGDIVRFHRLQMQDWQGKKQGCGQNHRTHYCVFDSAVGAQTNPRHVAGKPTLLDSDLARVEELRQWYREKSSGTQPALDDEQEKYRQTLGSFKHETFGDLYVRIVAIGKLETVGDLPVIKFVVWDGTIASAQSICPHTSGDVTQSPPLPHQFPYWDPANSDFEVQTQLPQSQLPKSGSFVTVTVYAAAAVSLDKEKVGTWVKLRNVLCKTSSSLPQTLEIDLTAKSGVNLVDDGTHPVTTLLSEYREHLAKGSGAATAPAHQLTVPSLPNPITEIHYSLLSWPFSSVKDALGAQPPAKFKIRVQTTAYYPPNFSEFVSTNSRKKPIFRFAMRLADSTGSLRALVDNDNAQTLLGGLTPAEAKTEAGTAKVAKVMGKIVRGDVWIDCCVQSYTVDSSLNFQLVHTKLVS